MENFDFDRIQDRQQRAALTRAMHKYKAGHSAAEALQKVLKATGCFSLAQIPADRVADAIRALGSDAQTGGGAPDWPQLKSVADLDAKQIYARWNGVGHRGESS